jgi:hypothetical protein
MTTATIHPVPEDSERSCLLLAGGTQPWPTAPAAVPNLAVPTFAAPGGNLQRAA